MDFFEEFMLRRNTIRLGEEDDTTESMREYLESVEINEPGSKIRLELHPPLPEDILALAAEKLAPAELDLIVVGKPSVVVLDLQSVGLFTNATSLTVEKDSGQPRGLLIGMLFSVETEEGKEAAKNTEPLVVNLGGVSALKGLKAVTLLRVTADLAPLAHCPALESLTLVDCPGLDLTALAGLPQLKSLTIREEQQHSVSSLAGLEGLTTLEHLHLAGLDGVAAVPDLAALKGLKRVELMEMKALASLDFLAGSTALEQLVVESAGKLEPESFRALTSLPELKHGLITLRRLKLSLVAREILPLAMPKARDEDEEDSDEEDGEEDDDEQDEEEDGEEDGEEDPSGLSLEAAREFWTWFAAEQGRFVSPGPVPTTDEEAQAFMQSLFPMIQEITQELKKAHEGLTVELQLDPALSGQREIIISADGQRSVFPAVEAMCDLAPEIEGWGVVRFRQPKPGPFDEKARISMNGVTFEMLGSFFELGAPDADGKRPTIVYTPGFSDDLSKQQRNAWYGALFIALDSLLGEKRVGDFVGELDVAPIEERPPEAKPLVEIQDALAA